MGLTFFILYGIIAVCNLISVWFGIEMLHLFSKPLLMPLLATAYFFTTSSARTVTHKLIIAALFFSWLGDIFLMSRDNENYFLLGLVSFLITHFLYIIGFSKEINLKEGTTLLRNRPYLMIPILLLFAGLIFLIYGQLELAMKIPVLVYAMVITSMVVVSLNRYDKVSDVSFKLTFLGALLFMLSDSLIAINKFYQPFTQASFFIMLLYISGQYLIVKGTAKTN